jgi:hypothetical protein
VNQHVPNPTKPKPWPGTAPSDVDSVRTPLEMEAVSGGLVGFFFCSPWVLAVLGGDWVQAARRWRRRFGTYVRVAAALLNCSHSTAALVLIMLHIRTHFLTARALDSRCCNGCPAPTVLTSPPHHPTRVGYDRRHLYSLTWCVFTAGSFHTSAARSVDTFGTRCANPAAHCSLKK